MDDTGFYLIQKARNLKGATARMVKYAGTTLVSALPHVIRLLGVIGTIAMLLVGGGMFVHNIDAVHHAVAVIPAPGGELLAGLIIGTTLVMLMHFFKTAKTAI
jgi:hypothetical protein